MGPKTVTLQLQLPPEIRRQLKTAAAAREIPVGEMVVRMWQEWPGNKAGLKEGQEG